MRNPAPVILTVFLALTAVVLSFRDESKEAAPNPSPPPVAGAAEPSTSPAANDVEPSPWPADNSDIPADPKAVFGNLPNGFRYMILPNADPPGRLSIRLHIAAGSLMEAENQRGLAHFLEHMVFNGTKHFKDANALIREMQSRGIAFGAHVNAYTSFDETVYMLDLPDLKPDTLGLAFNIMRDFGDGALLSEDEINAERGVILSEKRSRDSVSYRMMEQQFDALLPGSLISKRFPIGNESVISDAPRGLFTDFYEKYYVPRNMTLVVVGDVDPEEMRRKITSTFSSMENPAEDNSPPDLGDVTLPTGIQPHLFTDPELDSTEVSLTLVRPYELIPDTIATRTAKLPLAIANSIMDRRFQRLALLENSPITEGDASQFILFNNLEMGSISVTAADDLWQDATALLEREFRRALEHGFTAAELSEAKANTLNQYREAVKRKDSRKSEALASAIARAINDRTVFSTPEENLKIAENALSDITTSQINSEFAGFWKSPGHHLVLSTKSAGESALKTLEALFEKSKSTSVEAPADRSLSPFAYTAFGDPGTIKSTTKIEDLGATQLVLENGVRINLKPTDFEKNRIRLLARIGTGKLSQPKDKPLLDSFAQAIFDGGGLRKHSNDELAEILAGRNVSVSLGIDGDAFVLSGTTTPDDLLLQLQLMAASITDPGYRPEAYWQFKKSIPVLFQNLRHTTSGPLRELESWLHGGDARYSTPTESQLAAYTIDDVKSWLTPQLKDGYLELTIVGDFDPETINPYLLATFGTLPARNPEPAADTLNQRTVGFPAPPASKTFTYNSKIPQAVATAIWKTSGLRDNIPEFRRLNVLSDIYNDRLREEIREKLGASYSPNAGASGDDALEDFGYLVGQAIGKPEDIPLLLDTMNKIAAELAESGATANELSRALAPTLSSLEKSLRDNSYWLSTVLSRSQEDPGRLDLARNRDQDYRSITLGEINALAKKYFPPSNLNKISILPEEAASE